jgi:hypothetical protein
VKVDDYDYVIGANSELADGDVTCDLFPNSGTSNAWLFEIKDCSYYLPSQPVIISGPDTLCTIADPESFYSIDSVQWASGYEWRIQPDSAGSILSDSVTSQITWNPTFEGQVTVQARSFNDCGYSAWSEPHVTHVYTCMGLEEPGGGEAGKRGELEISPNPVKEVLSVRVSGLSLGKDYNLSIYDVFGRKVRKIIVLDGQEKFLINVEAFPAGVYIAILKNGVDVLESKKFVVAR